LIQDSLIQVSFLGMSPSSNISKKQEVPEAGHKKKRFYCVLETG